MSGAAGSTRYQRAMAVEEAIHLTAERLDAALLLVTGVHPAAEGDDQFNGAVHRIIADAHDSAQAAMRDWGDGDFHKETAVAPQARAAVIEDRLLLAGMSIGGLSVLHDALRAAATALLAADCNPIVSSRDGQRLPGAAQFLDQVQDAVAKHVDLVVEEMERRPRPASDNEGEWARVILDHAVRCNGKAIGIGDAAAQVVADNRGRS